MEQSTADAIRILNNAWRECDLEKGRPFLKWIRSQGILANAIRHLAYPDRDVYPKSRRGTKSKPVKLCGHRHDVMGVGCEPLKCNLPECNPHA